jgi:methyl-accepting chemotaxis protein
VNRRYQLRASLVAVAVVLAFLLLLDLTLYLSGREAAAGVVESAPALATQAWAHQRAQLDLMLLGSVVFLVGVFAVSLLETHKTAGAALSLARRLRDIQTGHYGARLTLRRGDNLREIETAFNDMAQALRDRTCEEIESLRELAARASRPPDSDGRSLASALEALAERKRKLVE